MLHLTDRGALCLGEYCRKVGFGVDGGGGWLWEMLCPVTDPAVKSAGHHGECSMIWISIGLLGFSVLAQAQVYSVIPSSGFKLSSSSWVNFIFFPSLV